MNNNENFATHIEVRQELMKMQKAGGAMIAPFALNKVFAMLLTEEEKRDKHYQNRLRSYSYTFCAIANEFYLFYCRERNAKQEFFILDERWKKYYISDDIRERAINFLQEKNLIFCGTKEIPPENKTVRTYKINLDTLTLYRKAAEELYQAERAKKNPF